MIRFQNILWIGYFLLIVISYPYVRNSYFPQNPSKFEKFISWILALVWLVSVPVTFILKQNEENDSHVFETSYDGFVGREQ